MEDYCQNHIKDYKLENGIITGFVESESDCIKFKDYLCKFGYSFSVRSSRNVNNSKSSNACSSQQHLLDHDYAVKASNLRVTFDYKSDMFFYCGKVTYMDCEHGKHYYKKDAVISHQDHPTTSRTRFSIQNTKKMGCPAVLQIREKHIFKDYLEKNEKMKRHIVKKKASKIRQEIAEGGDPAIITRYYIMLSTEHNHDITLQHMKIHPEIVKKIHELVEKGFNSVRDIKLHLSEKVGEMFPGDKPEKIHSSYYPSDEIIYSHIHNAVYTLKRSKFDQEALEIAIEKWEKDEPGAHFYFRPYCKDSSSILFCYQALWQKELMKQYGNNICLLDATYKTTKYALPLFFIVVKTNINYCVVGIFICHTESALAISEALTVFANWNTEWQPPYFMTDYCEAEINAINIVFPQCSVYLCAFHREQAWVRWVRKSGNVMFGKPDDILAIFRRVAKAATPQQYEDILKKLEGEPLWKNNFNVVTYFTKQWLSVKERWVMCFINRTLYNNVTTNNGVESQNNILKHCFLSKSSDKSLTGMLKVVIEQYLPNAHQKFIRCNIAFCSSSKKYNEVIPSFLHNRPHKYIKHVFTRYENAKEEFTESDIKKIKENIFSIKSSDRDGVIYEVDFEKVTCSCPDFAKHQLLCKHFCACFIYTNNSYDTLPEGYKNNPLFNLGANCSESFDPVSNNVEPVFPKSGENSHVRTRHLQQTLRELLKEGMNLSYNVEDDDALKTSIENITKINEALKSKSGKSSEGIDVLSNFNKRSGKEVEEIPLRKKKKK